ALHVPLGIASTSVGMAASVVIAVSSPHPTPQPEGWSAIEAAPSIVDSIPPESIASVNATFSRVVREEKSDEDAVPLDADEVKPMLGAVEIKPLLGAVEIKPLLGTVEIQPVETVLEAKIYLAVTAEPGGTMNVLGREKAVECFH